MFYIIIITEYNKNYVLIVYVNLLVSLVVREQCEKKGVLKIVINL